MQINITPEEIVGHLKNIILKAYGIEDCRSCGININPANLISDLSISYLELLSKDNESDQEEGFQEDTRDSVDVKS